MLSTVAMPRLPRTFMRRTPRIGRSPLASRLWGKTRYWLTSVGFSLPSRTGYTHTENLFEDGEWAILEWSGGGTWRGAFVGREPNGRSFKLRGCGFFRVVDGKIRFQRGYWDKLTWFKQLAIPVE
jgi:hypothetical protein